MREPLLCVPPVHIPNLWRAVEPMLAASYAAVDEFMPDDMLHRLVRADSLLWVLFEGDEIRLAIVTTLKRKPSGVACELTVCAGSALPALADWLPQIEQYARDEQCVKGYADGRVGWARVLPGYKAKRVTVEKLL